MGSRGSVLQQFLKQKKHGVLTVTDAEMTRFNISLKESVEMVLWSLVNSIGGEIFVPKIASFKIMDLAKAVCDKCKIQITGIRPGEKIHEEMISINDSNTTIDMHKYYAILPDYLMHKYKELKYKSVRSNFSYSSDTNTSFLNIKDLRDIIKNFE
jgi:FlaA1/EpsC-like NDP-sugar epimerase